MNLDGAKKALQALVRAMTQKYDYHAVRAAKVVSQNDDYTLELKPEDEAWPGMSHVPIRTGLPGCRFKVTAGARVLFTFEDGNPTRPVVTGWDEAGVERIIFKAGIVDLRDEKGRAIACNGDAVIIPSALGIPIGLFMPDPLGVGPPVPLVTPPAGQPMPLGITLRFATAGFYGMGQVVAVSPNRS